MNPQQIIERQIARLEYRKQYYQKNRERILEKVKIRNKNIEQKEYFRVYMRENRTKQMNRVNIKNGHYHPKFFNEQTMFNASDKAYFKKIYNIKEDNLLALKAENKYKQNENL